MIVIAIKNFFKDFFVVEVEEESSEAEQQSKKAEAEVRNNGRQVNTSKVTRLDLAKNGSTETTGKVKKDEDDRQSRPFFKKEKTPFSRQAPKRKHTADKNKENTLMNTDNRNAKVHLFEPRVFSETQDIADELKNERATLVNLSKVEAAPKKRIVDFLSGTVYALNGDIQKVGNDIFLCTPKSVVVEGEISSDKENLEET